MISLRRRPGVICLILLAAATSRPLLPAAPADGAQEEKPRATGVVEKAGVTLILLDVEVKDKSGRPRRGLTKEDFKLKLDWRSWPIYSVDDFCECGSRASDVAGKPPQDGAMPASAAAPAAQIVSSDLIRYVLYLDFSQLQLDGRSNTVKAAKKWIRETKKPDDEVMLAGYATVGGLRELCPLTRDAARLEAALDSAYENREMVDTFANGFVDRVEECQTCIWTDCKKCFVPPPCVECCPSCVHDAEEEYQHGRRSLKAFRMFLTSLENVPGRKAVLYFHENSVLFPAEFYAVSSSKIGNHLQLLEQVGAEATTSRAVVYPIQTGDNNLFDGLASAAVNLGANLADFTGGLYNRGPSDLFRVIDRAARECACTYRIGFEPPDASRTTVYQARIEVGGAPVPYRYRVQILTQVDRAVRKARSALMLPESASDLPVTAALVPVAAGEKGWDVAVQVALDVDAMNLLPAAGSETGQIDVGALLYRKEGTESWEMLTGSKVRKNGGAGTGSFILYERTVQNIKPGVYRLAAFARNVEMDLFGGAEVTLTLPSPREGGLVGPVAATPRRTVYASRLPLTRESRPDTGGQTEARTGSVPARALRVTRGEPLEMTTWICAADGSSVDPAQAVRFLARDGVPVFRLPQPRIEAAGRCFRISDTVETRELQTGRYIYHMQVKPTQAADPWSAELAFEIAPGPANDAAAAPGIP